MSAERVIYKYDLSLYERIQGLQLPANAEILSVGVDDRGGVTVPVLWALVDPLAIPEARHIAIVATGARFNDLEIDQLIGRLDIGHSNPVANVLRFHVFEVVA